MNTETKPEWLQIIEKEKIERTGTLTLKEQNLESIPVEIKDMNWLRRLELTSNKISKIENLENLENLETLLLSFNNIVKIENLDKLTKLTGLLISGNKILKLENLELPGLISLFIRDNFITKIENLENLQSLVLLGISGNKIEKIENINTLQNLSELDLKNNQIRKIENLTGLESLQKLNISANYISIVENLDSLDALGELVLTNNQIDEIKGLPSPDSLSYIDLERNNIRDISFLKSYLNLTFLGLSNNEIVDITVLGSLEKLDTLYLSQNKLKSIDSLEKLPNLKRIVLSNTGLTTLKPLLPHIKKGLLIKNIFAFDTNDGIYINGNSNLDVPQQIIEQGNDAVIQYYHLHENKSKALDEIYLNEAKLILVGEGKVGKSSLRVKLIDPDAILPKEDERTRAIDIDDYKFQLRDNENYIAHVWDFGGQNIQYALHRFFMTENSLYILMTESRNERDKNFMYWFQNIDLFGGKDSPILVVMNLMFGDRGANIDIASYVGEFKKIVNNEIIEVNLLTPQQDNGLQKLRTIIEQQLENLPHIRKPIFRCWLDVRQALQEEAKKTPYISIERYQQICLENEVEEAYFELVGRYLHNLGIVLWYHDKEFLRNKMILNPLWAISAIYKIIDDKLIQDRKGKFDNADKDRLWSDVSYRFSKDELTTLLKVFKICFQRQNRSEYIVPALMDANPPAIAKAWDKKGTKTVTFEYTFMPKGIANQLTADMHSHIVNELDDVWAYGVVLHYKEDNGTMAMVTENTYNRFISVEVKGNYTNRFMGIIIQELKDINRSYIGLKCEMKIPCPCEKCINHPSPQFYTEKDLVEKLNENKIKVYCNRLDDKIDIQPILEGIGISHPVFDKLKNDVEQEIIKAGSNPSSKRKVFLSYSHKQKTYFETFSADLRNSLRIPGYEFEIFDDFEIPIGEKWDDFLQKKVLDCDIMILLVSQNFLVSSYIQKSEFGKALQKLKNDNRFLLIPVYFSPCDFADDKELSDLQFFKPDGDAYGFAQKGNKFSYADLFTFGSDKTILPNSNRDQYMIDFVNRLKERIV